MTAAVPLGYRGWGEVGGGGEEGGKVPHKKKIKRGGGKTPTRRTRTHPLSPPPLPAKAQHPRHNGRHRWGLRKIGAAGTRWRGGGGRRPDVTEKTCTHSQSVRSGERARPRTHACRRGLARGTRRGGTRAPVGGGGARAAARSRRWKQRTATQPLPVGALAAAAATFGAAFGAGGGCGTPAASWPPAGGRAGGDASRGRTWRRRHGRRAGCPLPANRRAAAPIGGCS